MKSLQRLLKVSPSNFYMLGLFFLMLISCYGKTKIMPVALKCEYKTDPLGIDNIAPRFSWKLIEKNQKRGQKQSAYQILVASSLDNLNANIGDVWDSRKVVTDKSVNNTYKGRSLESAKQYFWKVKVWDVLGKVSKWSKSAKFSMGLLNQSDWKGEWIYKKDQNKKDHNWYRKSFFLKENPTSAFVFVGSFGYHELYVNGEKVTENVLNPAGSYLKKRVLYLTYDISGKLKKGDNVIAIWHAAGWSRWRQIKEYRMIPFVFKAQAEIEVGDEKISLVTDTTWKTKKSNSEYFGDWDVLRFGGETIDDRKAEPNWNTPSYDDSNWVNAGVYNYNFLNTNIPEGKNIRAFGDRGKGYRALYSPITAKLSSQIVEPQVKFKEIHPIAIQKNNNSSYRIDMGENYTGFFEMDLYNGVKGDSVLFEISDQTERVMNWNQKSMYLFGKSGKGKFKNRFNVAGGRWVTVYGLNYEPKLEDVKGYVVTSNRKQISRFKSSDSLLNTIYKVNLDTYLANTMDGILVDCPHRERRGWGEVTVAAMYGDALPNFESGAYMDQYLQYTRDAQLPDGQIRGIINAHDQPFLMWKANSPLTVWETYKVLGDKKVLEDNYESMQAWMTWLFKHSNYELGGALKTGKQGRNQFPGLGDWCTPRGNFWSSSNSPEAIHFNNCIYALMLENAMQMAKALGKKEDVQMYADRLKVQREATHKLSYNPKTGKYVDGFQVAQAFALLTGVTPVAERKKVYDNLVDNVLYKFPYYDTGSSGQALYTRYFIESGERMDLVYELLKDKHHPSYGYFIEQGKTVWPERWAAVGMSQIHTCYTGIGGYFIKGFGGIRPGLEQTGMQHMLIKPALVGDITFANTEYESMYGNVVVNWKKEGKGANFYIEVPVNTTAKVYLPATNKRVVREGEKKAHKSAGITYIGTEKSDAVGNYVVYNVVSGIYNFYVEELPKVAFPDPIIESNNLASLGRMNASSMFIKTEKLPGFEAFKANDQNIETRWLANTSKDQYLEVEWVKPQTFNQIIIEESGHNILSYKLQYFEEGVWKDISIGETCGKHKVYSFNAIKTSKCRIYVLDAKTPPSISEFKIYLSQ